MKHFKNILKIKYLKVASAVFITVVMSIFAGYFITNGANYLSANFLNIDSGGAYIYGNPAGNGLIVANGNVGIGISNPGAKLAVDGQIVKKIGLLGGGRVYCNNGISFNAATFTCSDPRVDFIENSTTIRNTVPIPTSFGAGAFAYTGLLNAVCFAFGGSGYSSSTSANTTNANRAYFTSDLGWYRITTSATIGFGDVTCNY